MVNFTPRRYHIGKSPWYLLCNTLGRPKGRCESVETPYSYQESICDYLSCRICLILINNSALKSAMTVSSTSLPSDSVPPSHVIWQFLLSIDDRTSLSNWRIHMILSRRTCLSALRRTAVTKSACFNVIWRIGIDEKGRIVGIRNGLSALYLSDVYSFTVSVPCGKTVLDVNERHYERSKIGPNGNTTANRSTVPTVDQYTDEMTDGRGTWRCAA
jgi:hypothetical protein